MTATVQGKPKPTFPHAGLSLALGLLSLTILLGFVGLPAVILGLVGLSRLRAANKKDGYSKCITAIVTGSIGFLAFSLIIASIVFAKQIAKLNDSDSKTQLLTIAANDSENLPFDITVRWDVDVVGASGSVNLRSGTAAQLIDVTDNGVVAIIDKKDLVIIPVWATDALDDYNEETSKPKQNPYIGTWVATSESSGDNIDNITTETTSTLDINADGSGRIDTEVILHEPFKGDKSMSLVEVGTWHLNSDGKSIETHCDNIKPDFRGFTKDGEELTQEGKLLFLKAILWDDPTPWTNDDEEKLKESDGTWVLDDQDRLEQSGGLTTKSYSRNPSFYSQNTDLITSYLSNRSTVESKIGSLSTISDNSLGKPDNTKVIIIDATRKCFNTLDKSLGNAAIIPKPLLLRAQVLLNKITNYALETELEDFDAACVNRDIDKAESLLADIRSFFPNNPQLPLYNSKLQKVKFEVASKSFQDAIQSKNIADALAKFNVVSGLIPNDSSIASLQTQLFQLKDQMFHGIDSKLATGSVANADKEYSDLATSFPDEPRLAEYKAKIIRAQFDLATKAFSQAIQSQHFVSASAELNEAEALLPEDVSLGTLQKQLLEAKFKAIVTAVAKGKDALRSNDLAGATQALADAKAIDADDTLTLAFQKQIVDFKYASGMSVVLADVSADKFSAASDALDQVLMDRPADPVASHLKTMVTDVAPIINAKRFIPGNDNDMASDSSDVIYQGRVIAWSPGVRFDRPPSYVVCSNESADDLYRVSVEPRLGNDSANLWAMSGGKAPSLGTTILVFGGPVSGPMDASDHTTIYGVVSVKRHYMFTMEPIKILPVNFIEQQKSAIVSEIKSVFPNSTPQ